MPLSLSITSAYKRREGRREEVVSTLTLNSESAGFKPLPEDRQS